MRIGDPDDSEKGIGQYNPTKKDTYSNYKYYMCQRKKLDYSQSESLLSVC